MSPNDIPDQTWTYDNDNKSWLYVCKMNFGVKHPKDGIAVCISVSDKELNNKHISEIPEDLLILKFTNATHCLANLMDKYQKQGFIS